MYRLLTIVIFIFCGQLAYTQSAWFSDLMKHRQEKDAKLKADTAGPIPKEYQDKFIGLHYFDPDNSYNITAEFIRLKRPVSVWFATSSGKEREYFKFATIKFKLFDKTYTLSAYYNKDIRAKEGLSKHTFVPFKDLTNLVETYGGGRYLDFDEPSDKTLQLDFNMAYNPYCAYSDGYSCPKVPSENYLDIRIPAGEKNLYTDH